MDSGQYYILKIKNVSSELEDILTSELFAIGAAGVQEDLKFHQLDRQYKPEIIEQKNKQLTVYFESPPADEELQYFLTNHPELEVTLNEHPIVDWLSEWKKQWKPFELIPGTWIVPEWEKDGFDVSGKNTIFIEPGMAFGTGTHETTQLASELLRELLSRSTVQSLVDVGTGSGILSFLAALLGVREIYAYDNDEESKRVFFENVEKNPLGSFVWEANWPQELPGKVDLCIANIIDGVLLSLKEDFQKLKSPYYLFTGILAERESEFLEEMLAGWPLKLIARKQKGEWVGFLFEEPR